MKVREMEIQIDKLGLEKLNVRLGKGGRVHWFLCCQNADNGNLVLYDGHGLAYTLPLSAFWPSEVWKVSVSDISIETPFGEDDGVLVDGVLARRSPRLDLTDYSE